MAKGNFEAYFKEDTVRFKKYLYVLRPVLACCWIEKNMEMAPMEFEVLLNAEIDDPAVRKAIDELLAKKKNGDELDRGNRISVIDNFITEKLAYFEIYLKKFNSRDVPGFDELNNIFRFTLKEAWN